MHSLCISGCSRQIVLYFLFNIIYGRSVTIRSLSAVFFRCKDCWSDEVDLSTRVPTKTNNMPRTMPHNPHSLEKRIQPSPAVEKIMCPRLGRWYVDHCGYAEDITSQCHLQWDLAKSKYALAHHSTLLTEENGWMA